MNEGKNKVILGIFFATIFFIALAIGRASVLNDNFKSNTQTQVQNNTNSKIIIGIGTENPPFEYSGVLGAKGINVDLANAFKEHTQREIEIVELSYDDLILSLANGNINMIISSIPVTEEMNEKFLLSEPYAKTNLAILTNLDERIINLEMLKEDGRKIVVEKGTSGAIYAQENFETAEIIILDTIEQCVNEIIVNGADAFVHDQITVFNQFDLARSELGALFLNLNHPSSWAIAIDKNDNILLNQVNEVIENFDFESSKTTYFHPTDITSYSSMGFQWYFDVNEDEDEN